MKRTWLVALILVAAPVAALGVDTTIDFTGPAMLEGELSVHESAAWGSFGFAGDLIGDVEIRAGQATWTQHHAGGARFTGQVSGTPGTQGQDAPSEELQQVQALLSAPGTWGLRVVGGSAEMPLSDLSLLGVVGPGHPHPFSPNDWPSPNLRAMPLLDSDTVGGAGTLDGAIRWTGDFQVELFGLHGSLSDQSGRRDLRNGYQQAMPLPNGEGYVDYVVYDLLELRNATLAMQASQAHISLLGSGMDLQIHGIGHFPLVKGGNLPGLGQQASDGTWRIDGTWNLTDLSPSEQGMEARLHGDASLLLDGKEVPSLSDSVIVTAASIGLGALVVGVLAKVAYGAALFTRLDGKEALQHDRRQLLYGYIQENPGATFREVCRQTDVPSGTARHHLSVLTRAQLITERRHRSTVRFFENHGKFDQNWNEVVLLREEGLGQIHDWIKQHPGCIQKDILEAADGWGWSRSTTQHRLGRLVKEGLLQVTQMGRRKQYEVAQPTRTSAHPLGWHRDMAAT